MKESAVTRHNYCLDQFARIASRLKELVTADEITGLVAELATIRAMLEPATVEMEGTSSSKRLRYLPAKLS
jgi:hypothetical protein